MKTCIFYNYNYVVVFLSACVQWPGNVHDSRVFANSAIKQILESRQHVHVISDSGYPCKPYLMTPFSNPGNESEIRYNYSLTGACMSVECCFGIKKKRFPW